MAIDVEARNRIRRQAARIDELVGTVNTLVEIIDNLHAAFGNLETRTTVEADVSDVIYELRSKTSQIGSITDDNSKEQPT